MQVTVDADGEVLTLQDPAGSRYQHLAVWLRDNCRGPAFRHPVSGQKRYDITDLPEAPRIAVAEIQGPELYVRFHPDGVESHFTLDWLTHPIEPAQPEANRFWRQADWPSPPDGYLYPQLAADPAALAACIAEISRNGFALVTAMPAVPNSVAGLVGLFGQVRETNYGRVFDVRAEVDPNNFANSAMLLGLHTDNPYRQPVPGLQLLHCLARDDAGGETLLADGYAVAADLAAEDAAAFAVLSETPVPFRYQDDDVDLWAKAPVITQDAAGQVSIIRYNNRAIAPFVLPAATMAAYYRALRQFAKRLKDPAYQLQINLQPGTCLIMDNHRTLHGRTGFTGLGKRHLQGCYAEKDGLLSYWRRWHGQPTETLCKPST